MPLPDPDITRVWLAPFRADEEPVLLAELTLRGPVHVAPDLQQALYIDMQQVENDGMTTVHHMHFSTGDAQEIYAGALPAFLGWLPGSTIAVLNAPSMEHPRQLYDLARGAWTPYQGGVVPSANPFQTGATPQWLDQERYLFGRDGGQELWIGNINGDYSRLFRVNGPLMHYQVVP